MGVMQMARKKSAFMEQIKDIRLAAQEATRKTYMQYLTDVAVIALSEEPMFPCPKCAEEDE